MSTKITSKIKLMLELFSEITYTKKIVARNNNPQALNPRTIPTSTHLNNQRLNGHLVVKMQVPKRKFENQSKI